MSTFQGRPKTATSLRRDLEALGVECGSTLMVHSSLSAIGWVVGGPPTVVGALVDAVGPEGTVAMPAATPLCGDPASWSAPTLPADWIEEVREHLPLFDPRTTPTTLGAIPETFRNWPGTLRSAHPLESVCARGARANLITSEHSLEFSEGEGGPFGKLHEMDSWILLLGVGFNRCTALHFAESLAPKRRVSTVRFPTMKDGRRMWVEAPNVADDNDTHFPAIGQEFLATGRARRGKVGDADSILFSMRDLVGTAVDYFDRVF